MTEPFVMLRDLFIRRRWKRLLSSSVLTKDSDTSVSFNGDKAPPDCGFEVNLEGIGAEGGGGGAEGEIFQKGEEGGTEREGRQGGRKREKCVCVLEIHMCVAVWERETSLLYGREKHHYYLENTFLY